METTNKPAIYFKTLYLRNIKCFKGEYELDFSDKNGKPAQWTVFLGNNNTGKTTILRILARCNPLFVSRANQEYKNFDKTQREKVKKAHQSKYNFIDTFQSYGYGAFDVVPFTTNASFVEEAILTRSGNTFSLITEENKSKIVPIDGYGISRKMSPAQLSSRTIENTSQGIFDSDDTLIDLEEWLLQLDYALKNGVRETEKIINSLESILKSELLPDIQGFKFTSTPINGGVKSFVEFQTDYGWVRLKELGYGYQSTIAWIMDLSKRMFERYPDLENPLHGPAVVLVDEIDLHLHPEWQRKIISFLSGLFPHTQFIVTAHSPLIVQSADNVNLVMLEKDGDSISIRQQFGSFQGWTVDEILRELMDLGDKTRSDKYLSLMKQFDEALLEDNYEKAQDAYEQLDKILSPSSHQRKVLQIQLAPLSSVHA